MCLSSREKALFLKSKTVETESGCWEWQGRIFTVGYGAVNPKIGGGGYAHRAMVEATIGPIPPKMQVMHSCDNRKCINPAHLSWGTQLENIRDMQAKKRQRGGSLPNEKNPNAKFTDDEILKIREAYALGARFTHIMREFQISESHLIRVVKNQTRDIQNVLP